MTAWASEQGQEVSECTLCRRLPLLLSDNEENGLLSMKEDVLHSNHLAEKEATRVSIFLEVKSVGCEE